MPLRIQILASKGKKCFEICDYNNLRFLSADCLKSSHFCLACLAKTLKMSDFLSTKYSCNSQGIILLPNNCINSEN